MSLGHSFYVGKNAPKYSPRTAIDAVVSFGVSPSIHATLVSFCCCKAQIITFTKNIDSQVEIFED